MSRVAQWMDDLWHDTRLGVRALRRNPGFTASAVFVLAVGIGLNLAFLHVVKATLSANLPFRDADTLVRIVRQSPEAERWALTQLSLIGTAYNLNRHRAYRVSGSHSERFTTASWCGAR
jgi:hypothetical protein